MPQPTALVVDDDEAIRYMVTKILQREDYAVEQARDGFEALEKIAGRDYDLILLDLMMPRIDGFGVLEHLRLQLPERLKRVVVMSALTPSTIGAMLTPIIRKPFDLQQLRSYARAVHERVSGMTSASAI